MKAAELASKIKALGIDVAYTQERTKETDAMVVLDWDKRIHIYRKALLPITVCGHSHFLFHPETENVSKALHQLGL